MNLSYQSLVDSLKKQNNLAVAFSGGADSALLAKAAYDALKDSAVAVTIVSEFQTEEEIENAKRTASIIGIRHILLPLNVLSIPEIANNPQNRCYFCKKYIFSSILAQARKLGINSVCEGSVKDDENDYRPGKAAITELGILSPLKDFSKVEIREMLKLLGFENYDSPSSPCLATRIPFFETIDTEKLKMVYEAENVLKKLGILIYRVRHHGKLAKIEVLPTDFEVILKHKESIINEFNKIGFTYVSLDINGFISGNLNKVI